MVKCFLFNRNYNYFYTQNLIFVYNLCIWFVLSGKLKHKSLVEIQSLLFFVNRGFLVYQINVGIVRFNDIEDMNDDKRINPRSCKKPRC